MNEVKVGITPDPVSLNDRMLKMKKLTFAQDCEISIETEVHELNAEGVSMFDLAKNLINVTPEQKEVAMQKHFPATLPPYSTRGSRVNAQTGQVDENGEITEKEALFGITIGDLKTITGKTDGDSCLEAFFDIVKMKMLETNTRGRN
jgi:hypothetical protein